MIHRLAVAAICLIAGVTPSVAQSPRQPSALVLIPGAGGAHPSDFLVLSTGLFQSAGLQTEMTTSASQAASLVADFKARGMRVTLVGMSLGAVTAAQALAAGARPDRVVFAAGGLLPPGTPNGSVRDTLGDPALLPPTLVLHHREDACRLTPPEAIPEFIRWTRGRARASWIVGGGGPGFPCRPNTPHTFTGRERAAAGAIINFARGR
jgi:dienelactone hydrolase